jgi:hypothetical protein
LGTGNIDFSTEKIEFAAKTEARRKLGISLGSISSLAMVGGTLAEPQTKLDKLSALGSAATVGAAVATFGLSIFAEKLLKIVNGKAPPCDVARNSSLIPDDRSAKGVRAPDDPAQRREKAGGGTLNNLGKGVGDIFDRLSGEK